VHVVVNPSFKVALIVLEGTTYGLAINRKVEGHCKDDDEDGRQAVAPDVNALVVHHEQAPQNFAGSREVDAIAVGDVHVLAHEGRGLLIVPNEVLFL
jgi:hypothetical protein